VVNAIKKAFEGEPYSVDNRIITANGEERIVHSDAEFTFNEDNIPVYARGIVQDITERKRAEEAIKKSRFILAKSQEMAHVGNWAWNVQTGEMNGSDENYRIYGYEPGDACPGEDWAMTRAHPDDRALLAEFIHSVKRDGMRKSVDYRIVRLEGDTRYVMTVADKIVRDKVGKRSSGSMASPRTLPSARRLRRRWLSSDLSSCPFLMV
jgi:PAS domain-containing protein